MLNFTDTLSDTLIKLKNHADLTRAGIPPEQALSVSFGEEASKQVFDTLGNIAAKETFTKNIKK